MKRKSNRKVPRRFTTTTLTRRRIAQFLAVIYILGNQAPLFAATYFTRPGAGVSRLPIEVMAFNAPGFGQVEDAINLANGNVFMAVEGLTRNNKKADAKTDEKTTESLDNNWSLSARLRLEGFKKNLTEAHDGFALFSGDGSGSSFVKTQPDFTTAPSWIKRYKNATGSNHFYRVQPLPGTKFSADWIVLRLRGANNAVAHYYDAGGTRHTFARDDQYLDFTQDQNQQFRSAKANDPDGDAGASPRTEISYEALSDEEIGQSKTTSGRIATVGDEYGRVTSYKWNDDGIPSTLDAINYYSDQTTNGQGYIRRTEFSYEMLLPASARVIKEIRFKAKDGRGSEVTRSTKFSYDQVQPANQGWRVLIKNIIRDGPNGAVTTNYSYSPNSDELSKVEEAGKATTTYAYASSNEFQGRLVTITETPTTGDAKVMKYHYDPQGRLRLRVITDKNPNTGETRDLSWKYGYVKSGAIGYLEESTGKTTHYIYDQRGNLLRELTFKTPVPNPLTQYELEVNASVPITFLGAGQTTKVAVAVKNDPSNKGVTYSTTIGTITEDGVYTAPASVPIDAKTTITVQSQLDPLKNKQVFIDLKAISINAAAPQKALRASEKVQIISNVLFDASNQGVTFATNLGTISSEGLYTAPVAIPNDTNATLTLTSKANTNRSTTLQIPLKAIEVKAVAATLGLVATESTQLSAKVLNDPSNGGVTWSTNIGTVTIDGMYQSPKVVPNNAVATITATSISDTSKSAAVQLNVTPLGITVVSPLLTMDLGTAQKVAANIVDDYFNQGVDWAATLGTISPLGDFLAPTGVDGPVTITATSRADPSKSAQITVALRPIDSVIIASPVTQLTATNTARFSAQVVGDRTSRGVTWSTDKGTISATGVYTAPKVVIPGDVAIITAISIADPRKTASSSINLLPLTMQNASPATNLDAGGVTKLTSKILGDTSNAGVIWTATPAGIGTISADGVYSAPKVLSQLTNVTLTATSITNPSLSASSSLSITPISVNISAANTAMLGASKQYIPAKVFNDYANAGVTWTSSAGSIAADGLFTAPNPTAVLQTISIAATSISDPTKTATIAITVPALGIQIASSASTTFGLNSVQLSARVDNDYRNLGVTWTTTAGTVSASGLFVAPSPGATSQNVTITARSVSDNTVTASTVISIPAISLLVSTPVSNLTAGLSTKVAARVDSDTRNLGVTWSVAPIGIGTIDAQGLFTSAASYTGTGSATITATSVADPSKSGTTTISITPIGGISATVAATEIFASQKTQIATLVTGDPSNSVSYAISPNVGTISASGLYTAPASVTTDTIVTVTATATKRTGLTTTVQFTLKPVTVKVIAAIATMTGGAKTNFAARVYGDVNNTGVNWSASAGSITAAGVFTAPFPTTAATTVTITATSKIDTSKTATATTTVNPLAVTLVKPGTTLVKAKTMQFSAYVNQRDTNTGITWTASTGTISATGLYTAPATVTANTTVTITAKSVADTTKSVSTTITVTPTQTTTTATVTLVSPVTSPAGIYAGQTLQLAGFVNGNPTNGGITWTVQTVSAGTISTTGLYTAPASLVTTTVTVRATSVSKTTAFAEVSFVVTQLAANLDIPVTRVTGQNPVVLAGEKIQLAGHVTGDIAFGGVTWTTSAGTISTTGLLTAPGAPITNPITVTATSVTAPTRSATLLVGVQTVSSVGLKAPIAAYAAGGGTTQAAVRATEKIQLSANVVGDLSNQGVTWSIDTAPSGYYSVQGSIDVNGVYTAPAQVTLPVGYPTTGIRIKATSIVDPSKSTTYDIRIAPLDVAIKAPIAAYIAGGDTTQPAIRATEKIQLSTNISGSLSNQSVNWSLVTVNAGNASGYYSVQGSVDANGVYTAPSQVAVIPAYGITGVRVMATSVVDPS
jgi:hypothetical protein